MNWYDYQHIFYLLNKTDRFIMPAVKEVAHERLDKRGFRTKLRNRVNTTNPGHVLTRNGFRKAVVRAGKSR